MAKCQIIFFELGKVGSDQPIYLFLHAEENHNDIYVKSC